MSTSGDTLKRYRVFAARRWADLDCTVPAKPGRRKRTIKLVDTIEEAQALCAAHNFDDDGNRIIRPYGFGYGFERI